MVINNNEKVIIEVKHSYWMFFWPVVLCLLLFALILPVLWLIYRIILFFTDECVITSQKFNIRTGILSKQEMSTPLDKINSVYFQQSFIGRIFNYGDIVIQSAASYGGISYTYVANPNQIKAALDNAIESYKDEQMRKQQEMLAQAINSNKQLTQQ